MLASAFYAASYSAAAVLTVDGVGEWCPPQRRSAAATTCSSSRNYTSRILSGCFIPHSHITLVSRSILASTSSWGSRLTANRDMPSAFSITDRPHAGRDVPGRSVVFRLLHRIDHDKSEIRRVVRGAGPRLDKRATHTVQYGH